VSGSAVDAVRPGFYGKLPAHGDFVSRQLPRDFIRPWDRWLQDLIRHSRSQLGEDWLACYLQSPFWRFLLGPGLCGDSPVAGVLMPSLDQGGRYFYLTTAAPVPARRLLWLVTDRQEWFQSLEQLSRRALDEDLTADQLIGELANAPLALPPVADDVPSAPVWHRALDEIAGLSQALTVLATDSLDHTLLAGSLWWTVGSPRVPAGLLHCREGLPPTGYCPGFLAGGW